ncbi:(2Fe-2S)-binding protein [Halobacteriovorax sp. GB3]|uniref:(2Fe-2S)-binding protein n=1 Tax=Halobacteriovorax sp. GB3 TaxID=2719615 RepID=UPI002360B321|nr:(2Fe-2S)-binding protein [Halobacteriovorax sp. GB3]MDD0853512.1 (2Fe-2S)-binding protein [Halobacteriovorax sp. GB3]
MQLFSDHLKAPAGCHKAFLPTVEHEFTLGDLKVLLSIELGRKNKIESFNYDFKGEVDSFLHSQFSYLKATLEGSELSNLDSLDWTSAQREGELFFIPYTLTKQLIKKLNFLGFARPIEEEGTLLCRCFGVSREKLLALLVKGEVTSALDATNLTMAQAGCASCSPDIEEFIQSYKDSLGLSIGSGEQSRFDRDQRYLLIQGKNPAYWILYIQEFLDLNCPGVDLVDLSGYDVVLSGELESSKAKEVFSKLKEETGIHFNPVL